MTMTEHEPAITRDELAEALDSRQFGLESSFVGGRELAVNVFAWLAARNAPESPVAAREAQPSLAADQRPPASYGHAGALPAAIPADDREPLGRIFHEQGRLTVNAERERPFILGPWEDRTDEQREIDMRGASAVAARAVHDAGLSLAARDAEIARLRAERDRIVLECGRRAVSSVGVARDAWLEAAGVARGEPPPEPAGQLRLPEEEP